MFAGNVIAQTQKFDVMTYTPPKGWTAGQNGQAKTFTIVDKSAGKFCMMFLYPSVANHGTPSQDFKYVWKTIVQEPFNAGGNPEKETTEADGFTIIQDGELIEFEGNKALALLTTVSGKGKVISLLSIFNDAKYATDVQKFLGGMDIDIKAETVVAVDSPKSSSSNSRLIGNGIAGVWVIYNKPYVFSGLQWSWFVFFNNGKSLSNMPNGGFYNLSAASYYDEQKNLPEYWSVGNYSFANGAGTNKKNNASNYLEKLKLVKPNQLSIDGTNYFKCVNVDGKKLEGSFTSFGNPNDPELKTLPIGSKPVITFTKDGKFADEGLFNTYLFDGATNPAAGKPGSGTYFLQDYSIVLKYTDGRIRQEAFSVPFSDNLDDASIIFISRSQINKMK